MNTVPVTATPEGEEFETKCACCGRPIYWGHGWLESTGAALAAYWYQWSEGHLGKFLLAIARFDGNEYLIPGVSSLVGQIRDEAIQYSIVDSRDQNWGDMTKPFGPLLSREESLINKTSIFELTDAITANDQRISSRILASGLQA
jgi:hypothetical protein